MAYFFNEEHRESAKMMSILPCSHLEFDLTADWAWRASVHSPIANITIDTLGVLPVRVYQIFYLTLRPLHLA
jgi:hypothetical protein